MLTVTLSQIHAYIYLSPYYAVAGGESNLVSGPEPPPGVCATVAAPSCATPPAT